MNREIPKDLIMLLKPYDKNVEKTAMLLRDFVIGQYPDSNELICDNYTQLPLVTRPLTDKRKPKTRNDLTVAYSQLNK